MTVYAEISIIVDTGCNSIEEAYKLLNDFNGINGKLVINTIEKRKADFCVKDYFIKSYIEEDDEAC